MLTCTLCGLTVADLSNCEIVHIDNKTIVVLKDGLGHSFKKIREYNETQALLARKNNHRRFHIARGIIKPDCPLCQKSIGGVCVQPQK